VLDVVARSKTSIHQKRDNQDLNINPAVIQQDTKIFVVLLYSRPRAAVKIEQFSFRRTISL
jgi:hypothetical protein